MASRSPPPTWLSTPWFALAAFALLCAVYSATYLHTYCVVDCWRTLLNHDYSLVDFSLSKGRPLFGVWLLFLRLIDLDLNQLIWLRLLALAVMALTAYQVQMLLLELRLPPIFSAGLSLGFLFLTPFQEMAAYELIAFYAVAVFMVVVVVRRRIIQQWRPTLGKRLGLDLPVIGVLFLSMNIYQPTVGVFWALAGTVMLVALFQGAPLEEGRLRSIFASGLGAMLLYVATTALVLSLPGVHLDGRGRPATLGMVGEKLGVATGMASSAANLFWLDINVGRMIVVGLCIVAGLLLAIRRSARAHPRFTATVVTLLLPTVGLTVAVNLIVYTGIHPPRVLMGIHMLCFFALGLAVREVAMSLERPRLLLAATVGWGVFLAAGAMNARVDVTRFVALPQAMEVRLVSDGLAPLKSERHANKTRIHVVASGGRYAGPAPELPPERYPTKGIFGSNSVGVGIFVDDMISALLDHLGVPGPYTIESSVSAPADLPANTFLLDLRGLNRTTAGQRVLP